MWSCKNKNTLRAAFLLIIVAVILVVFDLSAPKKIKVTFSEISFDHPKEFEFKESSDGSLKFKLGKDVEDVLDFEGTIKLFRDYNEYVTTAYLPGYIIDPKNGEYLSVARSTKYTDLLFLSDKKTERGDVIIKIGHSDAGGLLLRYFVYLSNPENNHSILVEMEEWTYREPPVSETIQKKRIVQQEMLDGLFEKMVGSLRFK